MKPVPASQIIFLWTQLLVLSLLTAACTQLGTTSTSTSVPSSAQIAEVVRVVDGDTIEVITNGSVHTVRYIGVDTLETKHPTRGVEPYGPEAAERNRQLVDGKTVYLEKDVSETDRYGRLLRYIYVDDVMVNAVLVEEGYARVSTYPPDVKHLTLFQKLQRRARDANLGLWATDSGSMAGEACDPAYPSVCIPPPPPDLNCGDIPHRRFTTLFPDPHGFDGDKDGVGCDK